VWKSYGLLGGEVKSYWLMGERKNGIYGKDGSYGSDRIDFVDGIDGGRDESLIT